MISKITNKLHQISYWLHYYAKKIEEPIHRKRLMEWYQIKGDEVLRVDYKDLSIDSIVFDLGGYLGEWSGLIQNRYNCKIFIFEPVGIYCDKISNRFLMNTNISVNNFALGNSDKEFEISIQSESSSAFKKTGKFQVVKQVELISFFDKNQISKIDLLKMNIEGAEYDLLDYMIEKGLLGMVKNFQIQFHDFFPEAKERRKTIINELSRTHHKTYGVDWIWENWRLNSSL